MKHLGLAILTLAGVAFAGPYDTWSNYRDVSVNTASGGANVVNPVMNFPLLVRLTNASAATGANVLSGSLSAGADVRFTDSTGETALSFEVERWSPAAAEFWVKVPAVRGNGTTKIRMYWGKASQTAASSGSAVFDTANNFVSVWHMNGTTTETSATAHGYVATPFGDPTVDAAGATGPGRSFNGTSQYFQALGTAASAMSFPAESSYTFSAWVKADSIVATGNNTGHAIVTKGDHQWALAIFGPSAPNRYYEITTKANNGWRQTTTRPRAYASYNGDTANSKVGIWRYVTGSWTGTTPSAVKSRIYTDGVLQFDTTWDVSANINNARNTNRDVHIGVLSNEGTGSTNATGTLVRYFKGTLDEINISRVVRDSNWVRLSYQTQKPGANAVTLGATQGPAAAASIRYVPTGAGVADTLPIIGLNEAVNIVPTITGLGTIDSVRIIGTTTTLPTGLSFNGTTGAITGTATAAFNAANRTIKAWSGADTASRVVRITAYVQPGPFTLTGYTQDTAVYALGAPVANGPKYTGRTPARFTVTPALPAGLTLDTASGVISGRATAAVAAANYTVKGFVPANLVHGADSSSRTVRITTSGTAEDYATWSRHRTIWLNTSVARHGAAISAPVYKFPVLVRLTNDSAFNIALAGGADIRFSKSNGTTPLAYEIERWDATGKNAAIWVLVDTIRVNDSTQTIQMHWGKAGATSQSSGPAVFSNANGFQTVVHMNAGSTGNEKDASTRAFTVTANGAPKDTVGIVGRARAFDGASQYLQVANSASGPLNHQLNENLTLSAWAYPTAVDQGSTGNKLIEKGDNQYTLQIYANTAGPKYWEFTIKANNTWNQCFSNASTSNTACQSNVTPIDAGAQLNTWHHVVGTYTKGGGTAAGIMNGTFAESLFVDGVPVNGRVFNLTSAQGRTETFNVNIGAEVMGAGTPPEGGAGNFDRFWTGFLDEVRISNVARSADWNKLEFSNQMATQNFVRFAAPTTAIGAASARVAQQNLLSVKAVGGGMLFRIQNVASTEKAVLDLVDMWGRTVFSGAFESNGHLAWNGAANNGQGVSAGVYIARVTVVDTQSKLRRVLEHKVPFTR
jgi:hypothetical protein